MRLVHERSLSPPVKTSFTDHSKARRLGTVSKKVLFSVLDPFCFCILCLSYCLVSSLQPLCHLPERADLLALLYVMFPCVFVSFPYGILGRVWYLILSIPDLCLLPYLVLIITKVIGSHRLKYCLKKAKQMLLFVTK